jgi:hypothetical protein
LAFLPVYYLRNFKKFNILCNSLTVCCSYPYFLLFLCAKNCLGTLTRVIMTYVIFLFLLIWHITFFLHLIGCLNPMIKYDWLAEISTLMWLVERRCDFSMNRTARSAIHAEIALLWTNQFAGKSIDFKLIFSKYYNNSFRTFGLANFRTVIYANVRASIFLGGGGIWGANSYFGGQDRIFKKVLVFAHAFFTGLSPPPGDLPPSQKGGNIPRN